MMFSKLRTYTTTPPVAAPATVPLPPPEQTPSTAPFMQMKWMPPTPRFLSAKSSATPTFPKEDHKMLWGEPVWFFFHTLSHKLKEDSFDLAKDGFLNICFVICQNLPCPTCAEHAKKYMERINFNAVQSKEQLKTLFFEFHNMVNSRKGYPIFERDKLDDKYELANTINMIRNFEIHFKGSYTTMHDISNHFFRDRALVMIRRWLKENIRHFN
jgi:hypothetical protein